MLENVIGRSPKAWGLGHNTEICFPPARGAYFPIKCGQNTGMEVSDEGVGLLGGRGAWLQIFANFFEGNFLRFFSKLRRFLEVMGCQNGLQN